jgi:putative ABC transport system permease protein
MVMGRLAAINGETTEARVAGLPDRERWAYTREQRLSWTEALPSDNTVVAGAFASDPALVEVSLEQRYADRLGVGLGDRLTFDVMGVPVDLHVTSLRQVQWESFQMNFFLLTEPGALDAAPRSHLVTLQVDADREDAVRDALAADFPNVTLVSVRALRDKAAGILGRLGAAIQALGAFTAASGVLILLASVSARTEARARQVALLKTLGTTRAGAAALLGVEYALVGLVAGTVGAVAGGGLAWALLTQLMTLPWQTPWLTLALAPLLTALGAAAAGVAGNARALAVRPGAALRS